MVTHTPFASRKAVWADTAVDDTLGFCKNSTARATMSARTGGVAADGVMPLTSLTLSVAVGAERAAEDSSGDNSGVFILASPMMAQESHEAVAGDERHQDVTEGA